MRLAAALSLALQLAAPTPPPSPAAGAGAASGAPSAADGAPALRGAASDAPVRARAGARAGASGPSTGAVPLDPAPPGAALTRLRGGGDEAPMCRSGCAGRFYRCASGGDAGDCAADLRTCRSLCDTASQPVGRLVSAPPLTGLPAAGPLQGFASPPPTAPPPR